MPEKIKYTADLILKGMNGKPDPVLILVLLIGFGVLCFFMVEGYVALANQYKVINVKRAKRTNKYVFQAFLPCARKHVEAEFKKLDRLIKKPNGEYAKYFVMGTNRRCKQYIGLCCTDGGFSKDFQDAVYDHFKTYRVRVKKLSMFVMKYIADLSAISK